MRLGGVYLLLGKAIPIVEDDPSPSSRLPDGFDPVKLIRSRQEYSDMLVMAPCL